MGQLLIGMLKSTVLSAFNDLGFGVNGEVRGTVRYQDGNAAGHIESIAGSTIHRTALGQNNGATGAGSGNGIVHVAVVNRCRSAFDVILCAVGLNEQGPHYIIVTLRSGIGIAGIGTQTTTALGHPSREGIALCSSCHQFIFVVAGHGHLSIFCNRRFVNGISTAKGSTIGRTGIATSHIAEGCFFLCAGGNRLHIGEGDRAGYILSLALAGNHGQLNLRTGFKGQTSTPGGAGDIAQGQIIGDRSGRCIGDCNRDRVLICDSITTVVGCIVTLGYYSDYRTCACHSTVAICFTRGRSFNTKLRYSKSGHISLQRRIYVDDQAARHRKAKQTANHTNRNGSTGAFHRTCQVANANRNGGNTRDPQGLHDSGTAHQEGTKDADHTNQGSNCEKIL